MANELDQAREVAEGVVDSFTDETIPKLSAYIGQENDIQKLERSLKFMERINTVLANKTNFGEMDEEGEEYLNGFRDDALERINHFKNTIPVLRNYIKKETNIQNLEQLVERLDYMNRRTNPADVSGV